MKNIKSSRCISFILILLLALSSVTFGAEDLSQSEIDDLISRVEKGDPEAQFELGLVYYNGQNVKQNYEQAIYWFKKAAENGHEEAKKIVSRIKITFVDANQPLNSKAQQDTAFQIRQIEDALALYRLHNGFYPSTEQGLQALVTSPTTPPLPTKHYQEGGYLKRVPNDVWGNPFVYRNFETEIQIMSYGRDGKKGGEGLDADIKNIEVRYEIEDAKQDNTKNITPTATNQSEKPEPVAANPQSKKSDYVELNPKIFKTEDEREAQATENAYAFEKKIIELANQISSSNQYSYQDMELVEGNTMVADEIVYMRAWQGKGYFFIRNYENKSWSKNQLTHFYLNDKSNVNFSGRIKIGCTLDDLTAVFGDKLEWSGSDRPSEWTLTTRSEWIMNFYISSKGYVHEIQYTTVGSITSKMSLLYAFNSGELLAADVTGQKVNIRDFPDTSGTNVVFQVNSSKDVLLVIDNANSHYHAIYNNINEGWYRVVGKISGNKFIPAEGEAYVIYKYIDIRPMTNVERNMISSALN